jgi:pSer/pThr/pTyr-binding forkhead associated (FHA) protein
MSTPEDNTRINANEDTVIGDNASDDTIIRIPIEETVVGSVEVIDETVIDGVILDDSTVVTSDDTVIPVSNTDEYNTLLRSMMDTSVGLRALIEEIDEEAAAAAVAVESGDVGDTAPLQEIASRFTIRHINGTKHQLGTPAIFGRLPSAPVRGDKGVNLVVVASPQGLVSSTHARVEVLGDVVVVTDLRSTNGTRVIIPGQATVLLAPGDSMALGVGAIIDLGDGNRLEVLG